MINSFSLIMLSVAVLLLSLGLRRVSKRLDSQEDWFNSVIVQAARAENKANDLGDRAIRAEGDIRTETEARKIDFFHVLRRMDQLQEDIGDLKGKING